MLHILQQLNLVAVEQHTFIVLKLFKQPGNNNAVGAHIVGYLLVRKVYKG